MRDVFHLVDLQVLDATGKAVGLTLLHGPRRIKVMFAFLLEELTPMQVTKPE